MASPSAPMEWDWTTLNLVILVIVLFLVLVGVGIAALLFGLRGYKKRDKDQW